MKHILMTLIALLCMASVGWSARDPMPRQWTKMAMDDVDPSPYQWKGPCGILVEIRETGFVWCDAILLVPEPGSTLQRWTHVAVKFTGLPATHGRPCFDGTWRTSISSVHLGIRRDPAWHFGGVGSRTASISVGFTDIEGLNPEVLRRIARDLMRKFELYAWPCEPNGQSGVTQEDAGANHTNDPVTLALPDGTVPDDPTRPDRGGSQGVLGQSDPCRDSHAAYSDLTGECRSGSESGGAAAAAPGGREAESLYEQGVSYWSGNGVPQDPVRARQLLHQAAEMGNALAQTWYGRSLIDGFGGEKDAPQGFQWMLRGAEQGEAESQHSLGMAYFHGWGTAVDMHKGCEWQRKAATQGHAWGVQMAGSCDFNGDDGPKNPTNGIAMFRQVLEMDDPRAAAAARYRLGWAYEKGIGVEKDLRRAAEYYRQSANAGYANGQFNYAFLLEHGMGVERNEAESLRWYRLAEQSGNQNASTKVKELSERLKNH